MKLVPNINYSEGIGGNVGSGNSGGIGGNVGNKNAGGISGKTGSSGSGSSGGSSGGGSGSCFVATAAFGTPLAYEIQVLRNWRDQKLRYLSFGRRFISFYYDKGVKAAKLLNRFPIFKAPVRTAIKLAIKLLKNYR